MELPYTLESVIKQYNLNSKLDYIYFWGHFPKSDGSIGLGCLSQWWSEHPFTVDGDLYPTAEHYMMAQKALLFNDKEIFNLVFKAKTPKEVKALGRRVKNFNQPIWFSNRHQIVLKGNLAKFSQHKELKDILISTEDKVLVEASPYDEVWGVKLSRADTAILNPNTWRGTNLLGFILMEVRDSLK